MTLKLNDAVDTLRIFCHALGHTPEINTENWERFHLLNVNFDYQGLYLDLSIHKISKTNEITARLFDMRANRCILNISARPEFVLDVVKQAAVRYPSSKNQVA